MNLLTGTQGALSGFKIGAATGIPHVAGIGAVAGFALGLFGGSSSSGSSGTGIGKKTKAAINLSQKAELKSLKEQTALAIQAQEVAVRLYDDLRDAKYEQELRDTEVAIEQRHANFQQARDFYEDSVTAFDETVNLNNISASMAMNDARRVYNDQRQNLNNQSQLLKMDLDSGLRDLRLDKALSKTRFQSSMSDTKITEDLIESRMATSIKDAKLNSNAINHNLKQAIIEGKDAIKESTRRFEFSTLKAVNEQKIRDLQLRSQKRQTKDSIDSTTRAVEYAADATKDTLKRRGVEFQDQKQQAKRAISDNTRGFNFATSQADRELQAKGIQLDVDKTQIRSELKNLEGEKDFILASSLQKEKDIYSSLDNTSAEADFAQQTLRLQQDESTAEAAIQTDQLRRQTLLQQGAQIARGQSGRSAAKSVQGIAFANQQAQALIASALVRADANYLIDKNKIAQSLGFARQQGESAIASVTNDLNRSSSEYAAASLRMKARKQELGLREVESRMVQDKLKYEEKNIQSQNNQITQQLKNAAKLSIIDADMLRDQFKKDSVDAKKQNKLASQLYSDTSKQAKITADTQTKQLKSDFKGLKAQAKTISKQLKGAQKSAQINLNQISNQLISTQAEFQAQFSRNTDAQEALRSTYTYNKSQNANSVTDLKDRMRVSYESLDYASTSLSENLQLQKERIDFDKALANRAAASQVLDQPKVPDTIPLPNYAPDLVQQPVPDIDWKGIEKQMAKDKKAKISRSYSSAPEFTGLISNIASIGEQAAKVANSFRPPPNVKQTQDYFQSNIMQNAIQGNAADMYQPQGGGLNYDAPSSWSSPAADLQLTSNIFDADISYELPTP